VAAVTRIGAGPPRQPHSFSPMMIVCFPLGQVIVAQYHHALFMLISRYFIFNFGKANL
jgi:hypothetical protein